MHGGPLIQLVVLPFFFFCCIGKWFLFCRLPGPRSDRPGRAGGRVAAGHQILQVCKLRHCTPQGVLSEAKTADDARTEKRRRRRRRRSRRSSRLERHPTRKQEFSLMSSANSTLPLFVRCLFLLAPSLRPGPTPFVASRTCCRCHWRLPAFACPRAVCPHTPAAAAATCQPWRLPRARRRA